MSVSVSRRFLDRIRPQRLKSRYLATSLTRRRLLRQTCSVALAVLLGTSVFLTVSSAERTRRSWGTTREVFLTVHRIERGAVIRAADIEQREVPVALLPEDALVIGRSSLNSRRTLVGRRMRSKVMAGEILTHSDLAEAGRGKMAALLEKDQVAVTIQLPSHRPPVEIGDQVDVYGRDGGITSGSQPVSGAAVGPLNLEGPVRRVARSAQVVKLDSSSGAATLLVSNLETVPILTASSNGGVALVITG